MTALIAVLLSYFLRALTSAGWIASPVLLPQLLRVKVMTAAISVSFSCLPNATIAVGVQFLTTPCSTVSICFCLGPVTTGEPSSGGNAGGAPLPVAWWQTTQFLAYTCSP